jgi:hypothetical protein
VTDDKDDKDSKTEAAGKAWEDIAPSLSERVIQAVTIVYGFRLRKQLGLPADEDPMEMVRKLAVPWETVIELIPPFAEWTKTLSRKPGRPRGSLSRKAPHSGYKEVACSARDFAMDHPGSVSPRSGGRHAWSPEFRAHILHLLGPEGPGAGMTLDEASDATGVPISTLVSWGVTGRPVRGGRSPRP